MPTAAGVARGALSASDSRSNGVVAPCWRVVALKGRPSIELPDGSWVCLVKAGDFGMPIFAAGRHNLSMGDLPKAALILDGAIIIATALSVYFNPSYRTTPVEPGSSSKPTVASPPASCRATTPSGTFFSLVRAACPHARIVFNPADLHHLREVRAAMLTEDADALRRAAVTRDHELFLVANADATIVVSEEERRQLAQVLPEARVSLVPLLRDAPGRHDGFDARADIAFIGAFNHAPNGEAVQVFLTDVWPLIRTN